jgi:dephospho-CoA kinase
VTEKNPQFISMAAEIIIRDFDIDTEKAGINALDTQSGFDRMRAILIHEVDYLIGHEQEKLMWILYRIDVPEQKLRQAIAESTENAAEVIADMIIQRQIEKAETRAKYSSGGGDWLEV